MHGPEWSDSPIVPTKPANKAGRPAAEPVEGRGGTEGNAELQSTVRTQSRAAVSQAQVRIREAVNRNRGEQLTALLHHITVDVLRAAFFALKKRAAPGIDAVTWDMYEERREENLRDLHVRVHAGAYRALPSRRTYIPKADGRQRPLGIAAIEDKIVQAAVVIILTPIYEAEFLGFSYGFRPGRSQHDALDALAYGIKGRNVRWVLDADIRSFFDTISHDWLVRFLEHRIADRRIIRLIQKWLKAGVLDRGSHVETEEGTPQGAVISPLLANVYLHYVYDRWVQAWRKRHATGDMIVVRYADDTIVGFQHRHDDFPGCFHLVFPHEEGGIPFHHIQQQGLIRFGFITIIGIFIPEDHVHRIQSHALPGSFGLKAKADIHFRLNADGKPVRAPGFCCFRWKSITGRRTEFNINNGCFLMKSFSGADIKRYILPAPVIDIKFNGGKCFNGRLGVYIFFFAVGFYLLALQPAI